MRERGARWWANTVRGSARLEKATAVGARVSSGASFGRARAGRATLGGGEGKLG